MAMGWQQNNGERGRGQRQQGGGILQPVGKIVDQIVSPPWGQMGEEVAAVRTVPPDIRVSPATDKDEATAKDKEAIKEERVNEKEQSGQSN